MVKRFPFQSWSAVEKSKVIRKILKQAHPKTKFTVKSRGRSVNVGWEDSVSLKTMKKLKLGHYELHVSDGRGGTTALNYVFLNRKIRPETQAKERAKMKASWNQAQWETFTEQRKMEMVWRELQKTDLPTVPKKRKYKKPKSV